MGKLSQEALDSRRMIARFRKLEQRRIAAGSNVISQSELAVTAGIDTKTYWDFLNKSKMPTEKIMATLENALSGMIWRRESRESD